jgi:uncharacterized protein (UPF0333 family)
LGITIAGLATVVAVVVMVILYVQSATEAASAQAAKEAADRAALNQKISTGSIDCYSVAAGSGTTEDAVNRGKRYSCNPIPMSVTDQFLIVITINGVNAQKASDLGVVLFCLADEVGGSGDSTYLSPSSGSDLHAALADFPSAMPGSGNSLLPIECTVRDNTKDLRTFKVQPKLANSS